MHHSFPFPPKCNPLCKKIHPDRSPQDFPRIKQKPLAFGRLKKPPQIIDMSTIQGDDTFLDIENAHLRVTGNVHAENVNLGSIRVNPSYGLSTVTNVGNTTSNTVQFTNPTTSLTTTGNVEIGGILTLNTVQLQANETLASVTNVGNATSETVQFTNPTTSFVCTGSGGAVLPTGTTAQQPTGVEGMVRFNTTTNKMEFYNGTFWNTISGYDSVTASGGSINDVTVGGIMYRTHTFSTVGTSPFIVTNGGNVECLIVAGGGGGGGRFHAGGGGGGGVIQLTNVDVTPTTYSIVVGDGGASGLATPASSSRGTNGQDSTAFGYTAIGGGGGGSNDTYYTGLNGGSGGGGSGSGINASHESGDGTSGQGHRGGIGLGTSSSGSERVGGGGGGAGGRGMHAAAYRTRDPGDGGPGDPINNFRNTRILWSREVEVVARQKLLIWALEVSVVVVMVVMVLV
jgi:hypothetical protein